MLTNSLPAFGKLVRGIAGGIALMFLAGSGFSQETTGSIQGTIHDPSGAALPDAKIEVLGGSLPASRSTVSDSNGRYYFHSLPAGTYHLSISARGFTTSRKTNLAVTLGRASLVEIKMEVGQINESVVVAANPVIVDTTSSQSAVTVDRSFFDRMTKGRGFDGLVELAPGARNEGKAGGFQIDGASGSENTFYLDGMEVTDIQLGNLSGQNRVQVEMIQQVQVKNGVTEAQYGGAMGGVVSAVIRSGSNEFHGQAGFYFDNDRMSARLRPTLEMDPNDPTRSRARYFQNPLDAYSNWNPVLDIGGPLVRDKLFFFAGFMPSITSSSRSVTFLSNNQTKSFDQKTVQQDAAAKLDYAPISRIRMNASWIWNHRYQRGVLPARQGTDSPVVDWSSRGNYSPSSILSGQFDYLATAKLIFSFRGGYSYSNLTDRYGLSDKTYIYSAANTMFPDIPASDVRASAGWVQQGSARQDFDISTRVNLNADAAYLFNWRGQHEFKAGWQANRLSNSVRQLYYPSGYYRFYWNQSYSCITTQCTGQQRGAYGYYRWVTAGLSGDASGNNQGIFFQDTWRVSRRLTLNLGFRTEREFLPSFSKQGIAAAPPIQFSWGSKMSPRVGGSFDPRGDGRMRFFAAWGHYFDVMKYTLPRNAFGGATSLVSFYTIDDPALMGKMMNYGYPSDPARLPGRLIELINSAIPANDPHACEKQGLPCTGMLIDANLKPMKQKMFDVGYDYSIHPSLLASLRYTNRRLIRTIEDTGTLGLEGEVYFIANPGFGFVADPKNWAPGIPPTPKAKRNYDAIELRLDKRFARNYQFAASYTWSRLWGNYSGLANSDEEGFAFPNLGRNFDLPWIGLTEKGQTSEGLLGTDRPHTFKLFGAYTHTSVLGSTTLSPNIQIYSGVPLTTNVYAISLIPTYPYGRGDMGRTPVFYNLDLNAMHDFLPLKSRESIKLRFELSAFNLFNSSIVTNRNSYLIHPDDGQLQFASQAEIFKGFNVVDLMKAQNRRTSPGYGLASGFQAPRTLRLQVSFFF